MSRRAAACLAVLALAALAGCQAPAGAGGESPTATRTATGFQTSSQEPSDSPTVYVCETHVLVERAATPGAEDLSILVAGFPSATTGLRLRVEDPSGAELFANTTEMPEPTTVSWHDVPSPPGASFFLAWMPDGRDLPFDPFVDNAEPTTRC